ncbi:MAG: hypothetical protein NTX50_08430 [Candidatus Sumerlaeota bacterium]|nr:hypothetical protein [Candidatus Sumerlaeota bacterium]
MSRSMIWKIALIILALVAVAARIERCVARENRMKQNAAAYERESSARMYTASASDKQEKERLEQLFAASGARVKVLSFKDQAGGIGKKWTSQYEAEVEFLDDCQLQESESACWTTTATLHPFFQKYPVVSGGQMKNVTYIRVPLKRPNDKTYITQFKRGDRKVINGIHAIGGIMTGDPKDVNFYTESGAYQVIGKRWFLDSNKIPTGEELK